MLAVGKNNKKPELLILEKPLGITTSITNFTGCKLHV
jgi:hypothetical protein